MTKLSEHFTLEELYHSDTADANGIDNTPDEAATANLRRLVTRVLEPLRVHFGRPIYVSSGYRCSMVNRLVGGASTSFHLTGCAADIRFNRSETEYNDADIFSYIVENLPYTELIAEGIPSGWVHVAFDPSRDDCKIKYMLSSEGVVYTSSYGKVLNLYKQYGIVPKE